MADIPTRSEIVFNGNAQQENLNIWGKLFIDKTGQGNDGWLVDSWSHSGTPYWRPLIMSAPLPENIHSLSASTHLSASWKLNKPSIEVRAHKLVFDLCPILPNSGPEPCPET
jgi:hypothetical protein